MFALNWMEIFIGRFNIFKQTMYGSIIIKKVTYFGMRLLLPETTITP